MNTRVIPCLLIKNRSLVKTEKFKNAVYIGDPINAVKIFNEKEVDELVFLDISASIEKRGIDFGLIEDIASECFMPFSYGGGIKSIEDIKRLINLGVEKIILNSIAVANIKFVEEAAQLFGSQSIIVSIDAKRDMFGRCCVYTHGGRVKTKLHPVGFALEIEKSGAGEILLTSIDMEGTLNGYDLELIKEVSGAVTIPVIANGGAGQLGHFQQAVQKGASAVAAGSMFVFHGKYKAVLISYPHINEVRKLMG
ncbi:MAG: AglZ/HisF2 family acetamidino modification protein [Candidatus Omnitrophica bacterium]|nr:AglZ/HisF2 family acetamidino modification protein [Candidatus Omnitrophota bacterium]